MNRDQFQKWIDEYVNDSYIPYIQCNDKEHALSYINGDCFKFCVNTKN